jgi:PEGA domain
MNSNQRLSIPIFLTILSLAFLSAIAGAQNSVQGELQFVGSTKAEKTAGVWIDGQYVGYVSELKDQKKVMLLPGQHEISVRQTGYLDMTQTYVVEPGKKLIITVKLDKDPKAQFSAVTSEVKLKVTPERAAVFVDGNFAGYVQQFSGMGRGMLVSPGAHHIKIALAGYQEFDTDVNLLPKQKVTIKTELVAGSITQAPPAIKQN